MEKMNLPKNSLLILSLLGAVGLGVGVGYVLFRPVAPIQHVHEEHTHEDHENIWTCSMHPQVRQGEEGSCPICGMDLIPLSENTSSDPTVLEMTPEAVKLAQIETTVVGLKGGGENQLILSGKIQQDERRTASQVAHIPGRIEKLYVSFEGESVRKGQKIANLYSPELITAQRELMLALKLKKTNPGLYDAARQKLLFWKLTESQISAMEQNQQIQETFDIYAEASGIVSSRKVTVGDHVSDGDVLFELMNLERLWVLFDAYEEDLAKMKIGDKVSFTTASVPGKTFMTSISFIDPVINPETRVATLRGELANPKSALKPEMFVKGTLSSGHKKNSTLNIPASAVLWTGKRSVVYVKVPDQAIPSYAYREVELGEKRGEFYEVQEGLEAGEEVVTQGSFTIDAAAQLNNQSSMMNEWVAGPGEEEASVPDYTLLSSALLKQQLGELVKGYLPMKDALVKSEVKASGTSAKAFLKILTVLKTTSEEEEVAEFLVSQLNKLRIHANLLSKEEKLEEQRKQFEFVSNTLIQLVTALGIQGDTFYVQHCPMAFDNQGADWLSMQREIRNPYFGDQMLACGWVSQEFSETIPQ